MVKLWSLTMLIFGAWLVAKANMVSVILGLLFGVVGIVSLFNLKIPRRSKTKNFNFAFDDISPEAKKELEGLARERRE